MTDRITRADVDRIAETVSEGLADGFSVQVQARSGHTCLDLFKGDARQDLLHVGTRREVYTYLQGMRRAHWLRTS